MDAGLRDRWLEHAHRTTSGAGRRAGAARSAVVELMASDGQCLVSAQDVTERLRDRGRASAASVYRALDELTGLGLLHRFVSRDGVARYEIADPEEHHHHHLVDDATGEIEPFADEELERAVDHAARRLGLRLSGHEIVLRGVRGDGAVYRLGGQMES